MGAKQSSSNPRVRTYSNVGPGPVTSNGAGGLAVGPSGSGINSRTRARSLGSVQNGAHGQSLSIPSHNGGAHGAGSPDSDASTPDEAPFPRGLMQASSLPVHLLSFHGKLSYCLILIRTAIQVDYLYQKLSLPYNKSIHKVDDPRRMTCSCHSVTVVIYIITQDCVNRVNKPNEADNFLAI